MDPSGINGQINREEQLEARDKIPLPAGLVVPSWQSSGDRSPAYRAAVGFRHVS